MIIVSRKKTFWFLAILATLGFIVSLFNEKRHLEQCVKWDYQGEQFAATNICNQSVYIQFQNAGDPEISATLRPGESLITGATRRELETMGMPCWDYWMFAACPEGYVSSEPFWPENCKTIISSEYDCVRKWRVAIKPRPFVNF